MTRSLFKRRFMYLSCSVVAFSAMGAPLVHAVSPSAIDQGKVLFEQEWTSHHPNRGGDGLGPLFNGRSCVACHNQSGMGGGGASEFNAKTIGIEKMTITGGVVDDDVIARMISLFHPGFVKPANSIVNTLPLAHHGGSPEFDAARAKILSQVPAEFSDVGGPVNAAQTRLSNGTPIVFEEQSGAFFVSIKARLFHRNTTALFGSGLIDQVSDKQIAKQVQIQKRNREISGRPSVLKDGRIGKFGWRANIASLIEFNDQACANEVGLKTVRVDQPSDPMVPDYQNPSSDISDSQLSGLNEFVASLPAPIRDVPSDSLLRIRAERGEQLFGSVGCSICHVANMGPAKELYSDLLLHDMGYESYDLNPAEPYRLKATPIRYVSKEVVNTLSRTPLSQSYYGASTSMTTVKYAPGELERDLATRDSIKSVPNRKRKGKGAVAQKPVQREAYSFVAPAQPPKIDVIDFGTHVERVAPKVTYYFDGGGASSRSSNSPLANLLSAGSRPAGSTTVAMVGGSRTIRTLAKVEHELTNVNQEWRTPPLWGVRDSAPYMHDGRAESLLEAIMMHGGEGLGTRERFLKLPFADRQAILAFLETLVAPPGESDV